MKGEGAEGDEEEEEKVLEEEGLGLEECCVCEGGGGTDGCGGFV